MVRPVMENVGGEHATGDAVATAPDAEGAAVAVVDGGALLAAVGVAGTLGVAEVGTHTP